MNIKAKIERKNIQKSTLKSSYKIGKKGSDLMGLMLCILSISPDYLCRNKSH